MTKKLGVRLGVVNLLVCLIVLERMYYLKLTKKLIMVRLGLVVVVGPAIELVWIGIRIEGW